MVPLKAEDVPKWGRGQRPSTDELQVVAGRRRSGGTSAKASRETIIDPVRHTSTVAEIQNTIRWPYPVVLADIEAKEVV